MKTIRLELDFLNGPIVKDVFSISQNKLITGVDVLDNDLELNNLNERACKLYSSFYEFDENNACLFNVSFACQHKQELMSLLDKLIRRLNQLNDGSFEIDNRVKEQLNDIK